MYQFATIAALRDHLGISQTEMVRYLGISLRTLTTIDSAPIKELDAKSLKLLELASLDLAVEYGDTSLALPRIAQAAAVFVSRMSRSEARKLRASS